MLFVMLYTFCTATSALTAVSVQCTVWLFLIDLSGMMFRCCVSDFEMVAVSPVVTGVTFVRTSHIRCISSVSCLHGVSKKFGEWYQKTNKTEFTNKLTLLANFERVHTVVFALMYWIYLLLTAQSRNA
jgi:hypothetical protein